MTVESKSADGEPVLDRLLETALYVTDMPAARQFYVEVLGCTPLLESDRLLALGIIDRSVLLLFQRGETLEPLETPGGVVPPHGGDGVQHIAFAISADALDAWVKKLEGAGIEIESRVRWPRGGESVYVRDPEGHSVEFVTPGLWPIY